MTQFKIYCEPKIRRFETAVVDLGEPFSDEAIQFIIDYSLIDFSSLPKEESSEKVPVMASSSGKMVSSQYAMINIGYKDRLAVYPNYFLGSSMIHTEYLTKVPGELDDWKDMFVGFGALAMHTLRLSGLTFGENLVVVGLGIIGNLFCQIAESAGFNVVGVDDREINLQIAKDGGIKSIANTGSDDWLGLVTRHLRSQPVDGLFTFTALEETSSIAGLLRDGGVIVHHHPNSGILDQMMVNSKGFVQRNLYGVLPDVAEKCYYPYSYVRWSFKQELRQFVKMLCDKNIELDPLYSAISKVELSEKAAVFEMPDENNFLGVQLEFAENLY